jgi:uncharacterized protein (DUF3820 family)
MAGEVGDDEGTAGRPSQTGGQADGHIEEPDPELLVELATSRMPFGRYQGRLLIDLPEPYVVWFRRQGFPRGRLGVLFALLYDVKANGLERLFDPLRDPPRGSTRR